MEITVNGDRVITDPANVTSYLNSLDIDPARVAVELNQEILPKAEYGATLLKDGDALEIVQFVGGGQ